MHTHALAAYMRCIEADDWQGVAKLLLSSAGKLHGCGADFLICPDNTVHRAVDLIRDTTALPWLHIAEEVAAVAAARGHRRLLVLGTRYLMESEVYPAKLAAHSIEHRIPDAETRERLDRLIMDELVMGEFKPATRSYFGEVIAEGGRLGCDAVVLGCTEIPLLIGAADSVLPVLDSTPCWPGRPCARPACRIGQVPNDDKARSRPFSRDCVRYRREPHGDHPADHPLPVVRRPGRRGGEVLHRHLQELEDRGPSPATARPGRRSTASPPGSVMTVEFELDGQPFTALNGGPDLQVQRGHLVPGRLRDAGGGRLLLGASSSRAATRRRSSAAGSRTSSACRGRSCPTVHGRDAHRPRSGEVASARCRRCCR